MNEAIIDKVMKFGMVYSIEHGWPIFCRKSKEAGVDDEALEALRDAGMDYDRLEDVKKEIYPKRPK